MTGILEDLRYGLRALVRYRGFTLVAVLSLALGIGANTTVFTLVNALLLHSLPVAEPARLAAVYTIDPQQPFPQYCSYPNYRDYRDGNQVFSSLFLYTGVVLNLTDHGDPKLLMGQIVTGNYFSTLGVNPAVGRLLLPEEDPGEAANAVAVISYRMWQRDFAGDPQVTARTVQLNGRAYQIVGVASRGFEGIDALTATDVWVPLAMYREVYPLAAAVYQRRALLFAVVGRLKPGMSLAQAEAGLQVMAQALERQYPRDNRGRRVRLMSLTESTIPPQDRPLIARAGVLLLIVSALVLLIGCGNVASLLLVRATGRRKEITVRLAMGASRWRLIRQLLAESVVLALVGGAAGLAFARWARDILWSMRPPLFAYAAVHLDLDGRVLGYAFATSVVAGIVFGLFPAWRATQSDLATDLKERTGRPAASGNWHPRSVLVMLQVAFSLVALVGAGLLLRSLLNADRFDPGFDANHLGVIVFNVADQGYNEGRGREFQRRALEAAATTPGVAAASLAKDWPFSVSLARTVYREGIDDMSGEGRVTWFGAVAPGHLPAIGIPILRGRDFSLLDTPSSPRVAIVNEAAASTLWPGANPLGKVIRLFHDNMPLEVVGVARNANYKTIGEAPRPLIYVSQVQYYSSEATLYIRTRGDAEELLATVRRRVQALDPNLLLQSETTRSTIRQSLWAQRLSAHLLAVFGGLALLLATIGIYGVISYSVSQRIREIGVRMALGATPAEVQLLILREGVRLVAIGVVAGLLISLATSRVVTSMLFVISPHDAITFVFVPAILALVAILACWIPALRATRIDPAVALHDE